MAAKVSLTPSAGGKRVAVERHLLGGDTLHFVLPAMVGDF
jgi:hypothetical protein